mmetsp:Transcript_6361/g.14784  ORF Transcript_6361/g.14784 Transcript_6361/m.14784 type:complete len:258 (+) Transcript_6361:10-783(+)
MLNRSPAQSELSRAPTPTHSRARADHPSTRGRSRPIWGGAAERPTARIYRLRWTDPREPPRLSPFCAPVPLAACATIRPRPDPSFCVSAEISSLTAPQKSASHHRAVRRPCAHVWPAAIRRRCINPREECWCTCSSFANLDHVWGIRPSAHASVGRSKTSTTSSVRSGVFDTSFSTSSSQLLALATSNRPICHDSRPPKLPSVSATPPPPPPPPPGSCIEKNVVYRKMSPTFSPPSPSFVQIARPPWFSTFRPNGTL